MRQIIILFLLLAATHLATAKPIERTVSALGFRGKIALTQLADDRVLVDIRNAKIHVTDTVRGHSIFPVLVGGRQQSFYFGRFGGSRFPMLIFGVTDPDRIQDSRVIAYQVGSGGLLMGQQVLVDDAVRHNHTDDVSGGRYQLASLDPQLGAIYSVSYQDARFPGFHRTFEKLRVRQWDADLNGFIETDQGFLRTSDGALVESTKFHSYTDRSRSQVFVANLRNLNAHHAPMRVTKAVPVSTMR